MPIVTTARAARPAPIISVLRTASALGELSKVRLSTFVLGTTAVAYVLAAESGIAWPHLLATIVGTAGAAFGANGLNQWLESDRDRRMRRTQRRPIPAGDISAGAALAFAGTCAVVGPLILAWYVNLLTAILGLLTIALYVLVYTPMKTRTPFNTFVGAVVGALPPLMGWTAVTGRVELGGLLLAAILFCWQLPHFFALAWLYRDDYARGGFRMLPNDDPTGRLTGWTMLAYTVLLIIVTAGLAPLGLTRWPFVVGAVALGVWMLAGVRQFLRQPTDGAARRVFFYSICYLPLLLILLLAGQR